MLRDVTTSVSRTPSVMTSKQKKKFVVREREKHEIVIKIPSKTWALTVKHNSLYLHAVHDDDDEWNYEECTIVILIQPAKKNIREKLSRFYGNYGGWSGWVKTYNGSQLNVWFFTENFCVLAGWLCWQRDDVSCCCCRHESARLMLNGFVTRHTKKENWKMWGVCLLAPVTNYKVVCFLTSILRNISTTFLLPRQLIVISYASNSIKHFFFH